ncbi:dihydrofolate reductase [Candidatus Parcubacteria bacterium]|jgi:dihydrofolate reductase|nr:dihydrofolate reductase [Candidatus Parcubacteria bacterium]MBT3949027.1 dihydrofolate reductase [Candidatus Parcubacteria bacterium]
MLSLIAAIAENNCIGKDNKLPWHIPEDLDHFKQLTLGNTVVMGQTTYESIIGYLGKPLPKRKNVVLTRDENFTAPDDVRIFYSIDEAFEKLKDEEVFVSGGASIYAQTIDKVDTLYITHVHQIVDGDTFFPEIDPAVWKEVEREDHEGFSFVKYIKS